MQFGNGTTIHGDVYTGGKHEYYISPKNQPEWFPEPLPPADKLPDAGKLPPGSRIPHPRNAVFTGRERELFILAKELIYNLRGTASNTQTVITTGPGGIGKTQLAVELCYRFGRFLHGIHWIQADLDITAEIAECGLEMCLGAWPAELREKVSMTRRAWQTQPNRLVVLDNIESAEILQEWLAYLSGVPILLTSRLKEWPPNLEVQHLPIPPFTQEESRSLLCKLAKRMQYVTRSDLNELCDRLGNLPLAIDLAGRYLYDSRTIPVQSYIDEIDKHSGSFHPSLRGKIKHNPTRHATDIYYTFLLSFSRLDRRVFDDEITINVFITSGYCSPSTPIPVVLLSKPDRLEPGDEFLDAILMRLYQLGLLEPGVDVKENFDMDPRESAPTQHILLADFARLQDKDHLQLKKFLRVLVNISIEEAVHGDNQAVHRLISHINSAIGYANQFKVTIPGTLWSGLGFLHKRIGKYQKAKELIVKGLKHYQTEDYFVATSLSELADVLEQLGDIATAEKTYKKSLAIFTKLGDSPFDQDNRQAYAGEEVYVSFAGFLCRNGHCDEAKKYAEKALKAYEKLYQPNHHLVGSAVNCIGEILLEQGKIDEAEKYFLRAKDILVEKHRKIRSSTASVYNNLGRVYITNSNYQQAFVHYRSSYRIYRRIFGLYHPDVSRVLNNLAQVQRLWQSHEKALLILACIIEIDSAVWNPDHPLVAHSYIEICDIYLTLGKTEQAQLACKKAIAILEKSASPEDPDLHYANQLLKKCNHQSNVHPE